MYKRFVKNFFLVSLGLPISFAGEDANASEKAETNDQAFPVAEAILRTEGPLMDMRINSERSLMAYTDQRGQSLRIMNLETQDIYEVTPHRVGSAFFWSPDAKRIFYRELVREGQKATSTLKAYDTLLHKTVTLDSIEGSSGYLTLDPRDYTFYMMHEKGIMSRRLDFPGQRFARWQERAKKTIDGGRFIATQKSILWLSDLGLTMTTLKDDASGVEAFDISPDGSTIAWATQSTQIYISHLGETPKQLGPGRDPRWHESRSLLLYSGGRMVGDRVYDFDVRVSDTKGIGRFLTNTPGITERWPQWWTEGTLIFTTEGSTDLWRIPYKERPEMTARSQNSGTVRQ